SLVVDSATSANGDITITNTGDADLGDTLTLQTVTAGGSGNVTATTLVGGDIIVAGPVTATENTVTIDSADSVSVATGGISAARGNVAITANTLNSAAIVDGITLSDGAINAA